MKKTRFLFCLSCAILIYSLRFFAFARRGVAIYRSLVLPYRIERKINCPQKGTAIRKLTLRTAVFTVLHGAAGSPLVLPGFCFTVTCTHYRQDTVKKLGAFS